MERGRLCRDTLRSVKRDERFNKVFKGFHLVSAGYSVTVGDFNGDGIEGKPLASARTSC